MTGAAIRGRLVAGLLLLVLGHSPALAVSSAPSSDLPDISAIRAQIYGGDHEKAIAALLELTQTVQHAELYSLLGYSHRSLGRHEEAGKYYREALFLDPAHRGALEYQGELFIATGNLDGARTNLRYLQLLCGEKGCAEEEQLRKALAEAEP